MEIRKKIKNLQKHQKTLKNQHKIKKGGKNIKWYQ